MSITAFLTDSTLCIGCKACEVACKEWNGVSEEMYVYFGMSGLYLACLSILDKKCQIIS